MVYTDMILICSEVEKENAEGRDFSGKREKEWQLRQFSGNGFTCEHRRAHLCRPIFVSRLDKHLDGVGCEDLREVGM